MKKNWTEVLKQKVDAYVPGDMQLPGFESLKQKMLSASSAGGASAGSKPAGATAPLRRKGLRYLAYAASLAALVAGGALLLRNGGGEGTTAQVAEPTAAVETVSAIPAITEPVSVIEPVTAGALADAAIKSNPAPAIKRPAAANVPTEYSQPEEDLFIEEQPKDEQPAASGETVSAEPKEAQGSETATGHDIYDGGSADPFAEPVKPVIKQLKRFSLGASGILASNSLGGGKPAPKGSPLEVTTDRNGTKYYSMGAPELQYHYTAPVSGGLSLRYQLTNQFYAETGLRFTYLRTWVTPSGAHQNLLYMGVPVGLGCKFVQKGGFDVYGSAYGMGSKCIMGHESTNFPSNFTKLDEIPLLLSASLAPGAEYHFNRYLSLYAEPTVSYYFKNDKAPETLYKENPVYFTLNLGIRFNL